MKKLLSLLVFITGIAQAQIVSIPDPAFKAALIANHVDTNSDGDIQVSEAENVAQLIIDSWPSITSIEGIQSFTNVNEVMLYNMPNLTTIDELSSMPNLNGIDLNNLPMVTSLNINGCTQLIRFTIWQGMDNLNSLNFSGFTHLQFLTLYGLGVGGPYMNLTSLNLTGCTGLTDVEIGHTNLATFNVSTCTALQTLHFNDNKVINLDVSGLTQLQTLDVHPITTSNILHSLNANGCTALSTVNVDDNTELETLYIKNGMNETLYLSDNTNLSFICADDSQVASIQSYLTSHGMASTVVNSYCSFTPGGNYNTITGKVTFDANNNGCDASDAVQQNIKININDGTLAGAGFTNNTGHYAFNILSGNFTITPGMEHPDWFNFSPASAVIPFADSNNNTVTQNFCLTANGVHPDIEVVIAPIGPARPGFDSYYMVTYANKGNQALSGNVTFSFDDAVSDFIASSVTPNLQSTGLLTYNYANLLPFESRSFYITLNTNDPTETPAVNNGDVLNFSAAVAPANDETPSDNVFQMHQTVVNSFDPNDITCVEGNIVSPSEIGNYLHYVVNFENTGTAPAQNIVVKDIINTAQFDLNSLQVLNSSATVSTRMTGNVTEFILENINLQPQAHGNVSFKIKTKNTLVAGNTVTQNAGIYFDYNFPVLTANENTIFQALNTTDIPVDASISVYPNPTKGHFSINANNNIKSIQVYDVQGRILQANLVNENQTAVDISNQSNGIYFIKIISDNGMKVQKVIKE